MAALSVQQVGVAGLTPAYTAAGAGGDTIPQSSDGRRFLHVKNGGGGSINVTITKQVASVRVPGVASALAISDMVVAVGAGAEKMIGPFSDAYRDGNGNVAITYSGVTTVTVAAIEVPAL
jgi:hypothetical protein